MSVDLLVLDDAPDLAAAAYFGGLPSLANRSEFHWPQCAECRRPMQYLGRVPHPLDPAKRVLIFQCANDPGMCDEWDPYAGGNQALIVDATPAARFVKPPWRGVTTLGASWSGHTEPCAADSYGAAHDEFERSDEQKRFVLGQLGGRPDWLQDDETPTCSACGNPMVLAAQLEEGPGRQASMNFGGGGCGYAFICTCPADEARFLWQSE